MATSELIVLLHGAPMGTLARDSRGRLSFAYSEDWLARDLPVPLSLSLPVLRETYAGREIENWLWGLLPDNEETLRRWAREFQVSARNVFALLSQLGEDVAGAVQFVHPDRVDTVRAGNDVRWLSDDEFMQRIRALKTDAALARQANDPGRFSLAGVQAKSAFLYRNGRWGVPSGRTPTTHIVKPATGTFEGLIENEHFCLRLAEAAGLNAARSRVLHFDDVTAIAVERYDRVAVDGELFRVHQEDMCQARGIHPVNRYENEGGPGVFDVFDVLNASSEPRRDREAFLRAQVFNFLIGGTDAHAKNFSVLLGEAGEVRLAPLYDMASMLPYADFKRLRLAMRIGGAYEFATTLPRHWQALGKKLRDLPPPVNLLEDYAQKLPALARDVAQQCAGEGLQNRIPGKLADSITSMCEYTLKQIGAFRSG